MHIEVAKELYDHYKNLDTSDVQTLKFLCIDQILDLAEKNGDEKIKSIVKTMKSYKDCKYKRATDKQLYTVSTFLLHKYENLNAVLAAAYNISEEEFKSIEY